MFLAGGPVDAAVGSAHADFVFWDHGGGDGLFVLGGVFVVLLLFAFLLAGFLFLGGGFDGFVVVGADVGDHVVEGVEARELEGAHEFEDGLFFIFGFDHEVHVRRARRQGRDAGVVFPSLPARDGFGRGFGVVHFRGDVLAFPGGENAGVEVDDVFGAFADLGGVEDDVVVVVVEDHGDIELFAQGQKLMNTPADVVVLEDQPVFDALWEGGIVFTEAGQGCFLVAEDATKMEDHDCVAVLLWGQFKKGQQFSVVVEVTEGIVNNGFTRGAELGELARMGGQAVPKFCGNLTDFSESFRSERSQLVAVFGVGGEGKHFTAEAQKFDAVAVIPPKHFGDVTDIGQTKLFDKFLASSYAGRLFFIRAVLGRVRRLIGMAEGMAVLEDGGDPAGSGAEYWWIGEAEVGVQTSLYSQNNVRDTAQG